MPSKQKKEQVQQPKPVSKTACWNCRVEPLPKQKKVVKEVFCKLCGDKVKKEHYEDHKNSELHMIRKDLLDKIPEMDKEQVEKCLELRF